MSRRTRLLAAIALSGAILAPGPLLAASDPLALCRTVADAASAGAKSPVKRAGHEKPNPVLEAKADALFGDGPSDVGASLQRLAGTPVWRAVRVEGTLRCQDDQFFRLRPDGSISGLDGPPVYADDLCWTSSRDLGTVAGHPALIQTDVVNSPFLGQDIKITPWQGADWGPSCQVSLRYLDRFTISEQFYAAGSLGADGVAMATRLAQAYARSRGGEFPDLSPVPDPSPDRIADLPEPDGDAQFPTFGGKAKTAWPSYSGAGVHGLVRLGGQSYWVRLGVGGLAWRELGDFLVVFYAADTAKPVASYVVKQQTTTPKSAEVSTPKPVVNTR